LGVLRSSIHDTNADFFAAPEIVSCVTAVRYILQQSTGGSFSELSQTDVPNLPSRLQCMYSIALIWILDAKIWDLVFYYWPWFKDRLISCINHVGIVTSVTWDFYHSTQRQNFTLSNLKEKEWKIAQEEQLFRI
jgi:hypothetical protein